MLDKVSTLGVYPAESTGEDAAKYAKKDILGKDDFLKILITELTHQDPLDPLKDRDMIAQMAQLSQLEQITQFTHSVDRFLNVLKDSFKTYQGIQAASVVGKLVKAEGVSTMIVNKDEVLSVSYFVDKDSVVTAKIYDKEGNLIEEEYIGNVNSGNHVFIPNYNLSDGVYTVSFDAVDADGNPVNVSIYGWGKVVEAHVKDDAIYILLNDGEEVPLSGVISYK